MAPFLQDALLYTCCLRIAVSKNFLKWENAFTFDAEQRKYSTVGHDRLSSLDQEDYLFPSNEKEWKLMIWAENFCLETCAIYDQFHRQNFKQTTIESGIPFLLVVDDSLISWAGRWYPDDRSPGTSSYADSWLHWSVPCATRQGPEFTLPHEAICHLQLKSHIVMCCIMSLRELQTNRRESGTDLIWQAKHDFESVFPFEQKQRRTVHAMGTRLGAASWKHCVVSPGDDLPPCLNVMDDDIWEMSVKSFVK